MPSESYSFLDVAVLDAVRQRFAAGDAVTIFSADLDQVLWANGPGAALLGYRDIEAAIGAGGGLPLIARRQVMAVGGYPDIGIDRAVALRLASGMTSRAVAVSAGAVAMPDGERAIMLTVPAAPAASRSAAEIAAHAIGGFTEDGQFLAFVDGDGCVEASSEGFEALDIAGETLAGLVAEVAGAHDRTVKRRIPAGGGSLPAGFARLTDDPPRHLLVVVEDAGSDAEWPETEPQAEKPLADDAAGSGVFQPAPDEAAASAPSVEPGAEPTREPERTVNRETEEVAREPAASGTQQEPEPAETAGALETQPEPLPQPRPAEIDRNAAPVRFVWRTDADGRFSSMSPEFASAVGEASADVLGRRFDEVADAFGLDPSAEIAGLLERRDTWSGRTVQWPVAGTDLRVPVDLAALPIYGRSRVFEGFRGFGVVRAADAVHDPDGAVIAAAGSAPADAAGTADLPAGSEAPVRPPEAEAADPFQGEVPALTIVPKPDRRFTDKVISLAEHRPPAVPAVNDKGLSNVERNAFREIGERLRRDNPASKSASDDTAPASPPPQETPAAGESGAVEIPRAPASEPGEVATNLTGVEENGPEAMPSDEGMVPVTDTDEQDIRDLARLDGETPLAENDEPAQPTFQASRGSLLDYADKAEEDSGRDADSLIGSDEPAHGETDAAGQALAGDEAAAGATDEEHRPAADEDGMAAADFADARDDESLPPKDEIGRDVPSDAPAASEAAGPDAGRGEDVESVRAGRPAAPALRTGGFMPSAFSLGGGPDTSILAKLPVPLLIHSGGKLHYANEDFFRLAGYGSLAALEDAGGLDALFAAPYADDSASDGTNRHLRLRTGEGREFPVEANLRSVPWRDGKALMLVLRRAGEGEGRPAAVAPAMSGEQMVQPDVSDLKARVAEMRTIIDTATDGVVLIDRDGTIRSISRPAEALFGFDSDEVTGKPFASLFAIESQRAARDYLAGLAEPGVASVLNDGREVIGREAQGRFIPLFMTIGRLPNDSGYCAVVRDITQWKRAEEDLTQARAVAERASSQKTDFLARISHEIRTPLNAIIGFSELMMDEKFGPVANDRYRDYLRDINRSGNHVLDLVNDLLDISKIEAGQQEMQYEAVSLNDTLAETVALMQPQANRERVIIRSSFASRLPDVVADLRSVRQIALNVLSNAIRYTQAGGQVIVSTAYETSGDVALRVRDTGVGMTPAEIEQALKPFKQINALKRGRGDGTGLGLPLTKAMVEANRARFTITSTPGEGTLVEVVFPSTRVLAD